jgi:hypothetical protein
MHAGMSPSPAWAQGDSATFRIHAQGVPSSGIALIRGDLERAEKRITEVLGPFHDTVSVRVLANRAGFSQALRDAWGMPETTCWMVGAADDHVFYLLSPSVWLEEACEHDPGDDIHRRNLLAHEAVHAYHGQANPSEDLGLLEDLGWFIEGLATYVSGQFEAFHASRAKEAVATGAAPQQLAHAWTGQYRYGVAGSMVAFIDARWGRQTLVNTLVVTSQPSLLALLNMAEADFLSEWRAWVRSQ